MRIGMFTDTYKPQINGVATSIETLVKELEEMGHEVYVVAQNESLTRYEITEHMIRVPGLKLHLIDDKRLTSFYPIRVINKIKSWNLDIIHTHTEFGIGTFARIFAKQYKIPLVHTYHTMYEDYSHYISRNNFIVDKPVKKIIKTLSKLYCNTTTELVVPTTKTKHTLMEYGLNKEPHVVPTGINIKRFYKENIDQSIITNLKNEYNIDESNFVVLYIGRLSKEKSIDFVIDSFKEVSVKHSNARLLIVGDGPDRHSLEKYVKKLGCVDSVIFAGKKPWDEIPIYYQLGDVFVTASQTETQGLTIIEALSASLPVLCYEDESFMPVINQGINGYFFTQRNQLSAQMNQLIEEPLLERKISEEARNSVIEFCSEKFADEILKVYNIALENGRIIYGDKNNNLEVINMRKPIMAGNWKMNKTYEEALAFVTEVAPKVPSSDVVETAICAPAIYLDMLVQNQGENLRIGAQNMHFENSGAFTGEISPVMLTDRKVTYVVLGHSERRQFFAETDETVNKKVHASFAHGLVPIVCVGESLEERETGVTNEIVKGQTVKGLEGLTTEQVEQVVIAYEPIWAIGTGRTATSEQANETCGYIRQVIEETYGTDTAAKIRIQYGGSVNPKNVDELMSQEHIDGALVGGASLEAASFLTLVEAAK